MNPNARKRHATLRDRRRYGPAVHSPYGYGRPIIGPLTGYDLFIASRLAGTVATMLMVSDPEYRARMLWEQERVSHALGFGSRPEARGPLAAVLPRVHRLAVVGRVDGGGTMHFLRSDPERPTEVYARRLR